MPRDVQSQTCTKQWQVTYAPPLSCTCVQPPRTHLTSSCDKPLRSHIGDELFHRIADTVADAADEIYEAEPNPTQAGDVVYASGEDVGAPTPTTGDGDVYAVPDKGTAFATRGRKESMRGKGCTKSA